MLTKFQVLKAHQIDGHGGVVDQDRGRRGAYQGLLDGRLESTFRLLYMGLDGHY